MPKLLSSEDANNLLLSNDVVILDIRDADSYQEAHIKNAMHLTMNELPRFCEETPKDKPVLVYCYHGISSQTIANHLVEQGFQMVYSLIGGFEGFIVRERLY